MRPTAPLIGLRLGDSERDADRAPPHCHTSSPAAAAARTVLFNRSITPASPHRLSLLFIPGCAQRLVLATDPMAAPRAAAVACAKQVTRQNFAEAVRELRANLEACDYVAVAAQKTGAPTGWRRALPVDTAETAYLKAKLAAESFQPLQFAVCPFRLRGSSPSTLVAYP